MVNDLRPVAPSRGSLGDIFHNSEGTDRRVLYTGFELGNDCSTKLEVGRVVDTVSHWDSAVLISIERAIFHVRRNIPDGLETRVRALLVVLGLPVIMHGRFIVVPINFLPVNCLIGMDIAFHVQRRSRLYIN